MKSSYFPNTSTYSYTRHNTNKKTQHPPHISSFEDIYFPTSFVTPLPNSEQINHPSSNYTYTKSIHHHDAPFVRLIQNTHKLLNCTHIRNTLSPLDLWTDPAAVTAMPVRWTEKLVGVPQAGRSPPPPLARVKGVGRQQWKNMKHGYVPYK